MTNRKVTGTLRLYKGIERYIDLRAKSSGEILMVVHGKVNEGHSVALAVDEDSGAAWHNPDGKSAPVLIYAKCQTHFNAMMSLDVLCGQLAKDLEMKK